MSTSAKLIPFCIRTTQRQRRQRHGPSSSSSAAAAAAASFLNNSDSNTKNNNVKRLEMRRRRTNAKNDSILVTAKTEEDDEDDNTSSTATTTTTTRDRLRMQLNEEVEGSMKTVSRAQQRERGGNRSTTTSVDDSEQQRLRRKEVLTSSPPRSNNINDLYERRQPRRETVDEFERKEEEEGVMRRRQEDVDRRVRSSVSKQSSSSSTTSRQQQQQQQQFTLTRSQLMGKEVVTRTSGVRLGQCSQMWVDFETWTVEALAIRQNALTGGVDHVKLSALRQVGDVVLVHDENAVERRWSSYNLSPVIGVDVITEVGAFIGRVRDFEFDPEDGSVKRLIVDAWGIAAIPDDVISTYAVDVREVLDAGKERILVEDGTEQRVEQLSVSLLQRLELTGTPWDEEEAFLRDRYYSNSTQRRRNNNNSFYDEFEEEEMIRFEQRQRSQQQQQQQRMRSSSQRITREQQKQPPQMMRRKKEGIPLMRPTEPYERKDYDGGRGQRPQFDAYLNPVDQRQYEYEEIYDKPRERESRESKRMNSPQQQQQQQQQQSSRRSQSSNKTTLSEDDYL